VVGFGLQQNATDSSGRGAEVDEQRLVLGLSAGERAVQVFRPFQGHELLRKKIDAVEMRRVVGMIRSILFDL